ncbi:hypothetical protein [Sphaerimonospora thailandensis]|uniref:Uncharacterized protein n=1 Tax=Sphaerimonospora thailandensis TaxID=795644 RepID=A0A8J3R5U4_9ACTN|nr:hypothetical protein [Sphaerimonospora thailandensis]GIH69038.1 hypothetical protein Mth01_12910 [Sphaerimonospora thailandensis]
MPSPEVVQCRTDMAAAAAAVHEVLDALGAVPGVFGDATWKGPAADRWAADWNARKSQLTALLHAVLSEQPHLVARLEEATRRRAAL